MSIKEVHPYDYLHSISYYALERAKKSNEGSFFECIVSIVFDALCLESYLNHLGYEKLSPTELDSYQRLDSKNKLNRISNLIKFSIDKNSVPFCHFSTIFNFRDEIVHAKTKKVGPIQVQIDRQTLKPKIPKTFIEQNADLSMQKNNYNSMVEMNIAITCCGRL